MLHPATKRDLLLRTWVFIFDIGTPKKQNMQNTLKQSILAQGIGLHSGMSVQMEIHPAPENHGIVFVRTDVAPGQGVVPALWDKVVDTRLCTVIGNEHGARIGTIEHVMSALRGCGIDNALIGINGPEVPVMDGSAMPFVELIEQAGKIVQSAPRRVIRILQEIIVQDGDKRAALRPAEGSIFGGEISFDHPQIGTQKFMTQLVNGNFRHDIAGSRTFGFMKDVEAMRQNGLALGGSLDNAILLGPDGVINPGGLRHGDEFIRHKLLDAIGDLYLAGGRILGAYDGVKAGHALNNALLHALFAQTSSWEWAELYGDMTQALPLASLQQAESLANA